MMKIKHILSVCFITLFLISNQTKAQYSIAGIPRSISGKLRPVHESRSIQHLGEVKLPRLAPDLIQEELKKNNTESRRLVFAVARPLEEKLMSQGSWSQDTETGDYIWRLSITSPEASSIGIRLENYQLPEGARLYAYGKDRRIYGAFTKLNNNTNQVLQLAPIRGEEIILEYNCNPKQVRRALPFRIATLYHDFRGVNQLLKEQKDSFKANGPGEPLYNRKLYELSCAPNVIQIPEREQQARSVVLMIVGGVEICTGALINNTKGDGTPYILTAAHCINGNYQEPEANIETYIRQVTSGTVIFFGFESPIANTNVRGSEEKTLSSTEMVAYNPEADMALLRISGLPTDPNTGHQIPIPPAYNPYFSGWNIEATPRAPFFGIHHPYGTTKRYSEVEDKQLFLIDYSVGDSPEWEGRHWRIQKWLIGTTDAGASGSPLFDKNGLIIGALTGGSSSCNSPTGDSYYAIRTSWRIGDHPEIKTAQQSLATWLDPENSGATSCLGYDPLSKEPIKRIGPLYKASNIYEIDHVSEEEELIGVGNSVNIEAPQSKILGAHILFRGDYKLKDGIPPLKLSLYPLLSDNEVGAPIWEVNHSTANYIYYDKEKMNFSANQRTLDSDTIELFIPTPVDQIQELNLSGNYLLSCQTETETLFNIPLLTQEHRTTEEVLWPAWQRKKDGVWKRNQNKAYQGYWIDLLLQSDREATIDKPKNGGTDVPFVLYHQEGYLYILNNPSVPNPGTAYLRVYAVFDGKLVYESLISSGTQEVHLPKLIRGIYVAEIKRENNRQSLKFRVD